MKYRKYEDLPPSISLEKVIRSRKSGKITWVLGMFLLMFIMLLAVTQLQILKIRAASDMVSDALAAGGLASALIDVERYGTDHTVVISDAEEAYSVYKNLLPDNLGLESPECDERNVEGKDSVICGPVNIEKFYIYNVTGDTVETVLVEDSGVTERSVGALGEVCAPNGKIIRSTGIYSEISFRVKGIFGAVYEACKGKLVEINSEADD